MVGTYDVMELDSPVGRVQVEKQGLYYRFSCRCPLKSVKMYRLQVVCGNVREDLGILVPMDGGFGAEKKVPCKRFGPGVPEFRLVTGKQSSPGTFVPLYPEEPFSYMARLKDAFLQTQAGQMGLVIPK